MGPWWIGGEFLQEGFLNSRSKIWWCKMRDDGEDSSRWWMRMDEAVIRSTHEGSQQKWRWMLDASLRERVRCAKVTNVREMGFT